MNTRIPYTDLITETRNRGIKTAVYSVIDNGEDEHRENEFVLIVDNNLDDVAFTGKVRVGIQNVDAPTVGHTDPTWFQLLKQYDEYISKHEEISEKIYFKGVVLSAIPSDTAGVSRIDIVYGN